MRAWKQRRDTLTSFVICATVVVLSAILYPLILLFFTLVALIYPAYQRLNPRRKGAGDRAAVGEEAGK